MEPVTFKEVAHLINLSPITRIDVDSPLRDEPQWALYPARYTIQRHRYEFRVLNLKAGAKTEDLRAAHKELGGRLQDTDVVFAPSLSPQNKALHDLFAAARTLCDTPEYCKRFLESDLEQYADALERTYPEPPYYVAPVIVPPAGPGTRWDSVLDFLRSDPGVGEKDGQKLGVVLAEAGQGKTYHSQYMAWHLTKDWRTKGKRLPIYIDSKQWSQLSKDDLASISKTIFHSFRYFGSPLSWLDGHEEQFLRTTLRLGLFTLIFDGLDEYVLWNARVSAGDALDALVAMASSTTARIVVTSRASFWKSDILPQRPDAEATSVFAFELSPFDKNHARNYFRKRLPEPDADRALGVFSTLHAQDAAMAGRGFVLHLVADLFDKGAAPSSHPSAQPGRNIVEWLMPALCERERTRQKLPVSAEEQLAVLRELAVESAQGAILDDETVSLALQSVASAAVDEHSAPAVMDKMSAHPLIERYGAPHHWRFTQEYARNLLIAQHVDDFVDKRRLDDVQKFLARIDTSKGSAAVDVVALAEMLVTVSLARGDGTADRVKLLISACSSDKPSAPPRSATLARFVSELALGTVKALLPHGSRLERRNLLTSLFDALVRPSPRVPRLALAGTLAAFDFRGVLFDECSFEEVTFANCDFDEKTTFRNCRFTGGRDVSSSGFGRAQFLPRPSGDPEALRWIRNRQVAESQRQYKSEDLAEDMGELLRKFIGRGGVGLKSIEAASFRTGGIQHSPHGNDIMDVVQRRLLGVHTISGAGDGLHVRKEAEEALRFFANNNNFTGVVLEAFRELQRKLGLEG